MMNTRGMKMVCLVSVSGLALLAAGCSSTKTAPPPVVNTVPAPYAEPIPVPVAQPPANTEMPNLEVIPVDKKAAKHSGKSSMPAKTDSKAVTYTVAKGDSLWKIASSYGVSVKELAAFNKMKDTDALKAGTTLNLPPGAHAGAKPKVSSKGAKAEKADKAPAKHAKTEKVAKSDKPATTKPAKAEKAEKPAKAEKADKTAKAEKTDKAAKGDKTVADAKPAKTDKTAATPAAATKPAAAKPDVAAAPAAAPAVATPAAPAAAGNTLEHTVLMGEKLESVADMYEVTVADILKANPAVKGNDDLKPNMTLLVPFKQ